MVTPLGPNGLFRHLGDGNGSEIDSLFRGLEWDQGTPEWDEADELGTSGAKTIVPSIFLV